LNNIIDAYTHNVPPTYLKELVKSSDSRLSKVAQRTIEQCNAQPNMIDFEKRLAEMDKFGIGKQVTCVWQAVDPNHLPVEDSEEQIRLCRLINDDMADALKMGKGRIFALGTAPLRALDVGGLEEIRRAINDLGLRGFMVVTNVRGEPVDRFRLFWEEANRLGVPVYLHPVDPITSTSRPYEDEYDLMHVLGWPFETSLTMARLVLSGTMSRNPNLRIVAHHLGAMIPFFAGRINESYDKEMDLVKPEQGVSEIASKKRAIEYFDSFYYDTAIGGNKLAIEMTRDLFGAERLIFGTDYPFGPRKGEVRLSTYPKLVDEANFSIKEKQLIFEENAMRLLKI